MEVFIMAWQKNLEHIAYLVIIDKLRSYQVILLKLSMLKPIKFLLIFVQIVIDEMEMNVDTPINIKNVICSFVHPDIKQLS